MLKSLQIKNLALIAQAEVEFQSGFWAVTGETGAGKSVLISALKLLCGAKPTAQSIRKGEDAAVLRGVFFINQIPEALAFLDEKKITCEDGELEIQREIFASGKSKQRLNGTLISQSDLQEIGEMLVQMHGQSEQILLRDSKSQQKIIDVYCENEQILEKCKEQFESWNAIQKQIEERKKNAETIAEQKEFLLFQLNELQKANLQINDEEECEKIVRESSSGELTRKIAVECRDILEGDNGILDKLGELSSKLEKFKSKCEDAPSEDGVIAAEDILKNLTYELSKLAKPNLYSEHEIEEANSRIALIQKLKRKYRADLPALIELREKRKRELESLENIDADVGELQKQAYKVRIDFEKTSAELSKRRKAGAKKLDLEVEKKLHSLSMPTAIFSTRWVLAEHLNASGAEHCEFWIAPNKGEGEKPLKQCVSGGELSRVLLAFKCAIAAKDKVPLLVFDEVDSGISGEVANSIGESLSELGKFHQVLTITHLHQVAALAEGQFRVRKVEENGRTFTLIQPLSKQERVLEIARMLGDEKSPTVQAHARELLD